MPSFSVYKSTPYWCKCNCVAIARQNQAKRDLANVLGEDLNLKMKKVQVANTLQTSGRLWRVIAMEKGKGM